MHRVTGASVLVNGVAALLVASAVPAYTLAQDFGDTLHLHAALELAREANPSLRAAAHRAVAAAERIPQAGALPDPMLSLGLVNRDVSGFGMGTAMAMNTVQLTQRLPWPGKLGFAEERASHLAQALQHDAVEAELGLLAEVKALYMRLAFMDRAIEIMESTRVLLTEFFDVSSSMYAVGRGQQQDVLQAQVAVTRMTEDITVMEQSRAASATRLNSMLGRDVETPIVALELPELGGTPPTVDSLMQLARVGRPAFAAASERSLAADAGVHAARRALYPDLTFTLGYGHRPDYSDVATVMVGVDFPRFCGHRVKPHSVVHTPLG